MSKKTKKDKKDKTKTLKGTKVVREVELKLDDDTYSRLGKEEGALLVSQANLTAEFKEVKDKWNERLEPIAERLGQLRQALKDGKEVKTLECIAVNNFDANQVEYWFDGKIVDTRTMTHEDRQAGLELPQKKTRRGRDAKQKAANDKDLPEAEDQDISNVRKLETSRHTKHSSTDGPAGNGQLHRDGAYEDKPAGA